MIHLIDGQILLINVIVHRKCPINIGIDRFKIFHVTPSSQNFPCDLIRKFWPGGIVGLYHTMIPTAILTTLHAIAQM